MAKPRIFVSSTYYDLRHIRSSLESFIEGMGYEPVLFESGDIPFHHDLALADACYSEVQNCHMLVLIIGGRYGSADVERKADVSPEKIQKMYDVYNSITKREYETARDREIPIFIFVDKNVRSEYKTFEANRSNTTISYAHVDSVNVFKLLDDILRQRTNNYIREFERFEDISGWLRDQWAGIFADLIIKRKDHRLISSMAERILELGEITSSMKSYTETIMKKVVPEAAEEKINTEEKREIDRRLQRFKDEPLISNIIETHQILSLNPPRVLDLFNAISESTSLQDFLSRFPGDASILKSMETSNYESEYKDLKRKYFGNNRIWWVSTNHKN